MAEESTAQKRKREEPITSVSMQSAGDVVCLKLFIDTKKHKVMFAEAGKPFIDFLIHSLSMPMGAMVSSEAAMVSSFSLSKLKASIENLDASYFRPNVNKQNLLNPKASLLSSSNVLLWYYDVNTIRKEKKLYRCNHGCSARCSCISYVAENPTSCCPQCKNLMNNSVTIVRPPEGSLTKNDLGYVKPMVTYMVMDDLVVKPMSTVLVITELKSVECKDYQEKAVYLGKEEALKLLKVALTTDKVLTTMFMVKAEEED